MPKSIFILTREQNGPCGHGEPAVPYLTIRTEGGERFDLGEPSPAFATREAAEKFRAERDRWNYWTVTEIELVD